MARKTYRHDFSGALHFVRHALFVVGAFMYFGGGPDLSRRAIILMAIGAPYSLPFRLLWRWFGPKPKPVTPEKLFDILSPYVRPASDAERSLLLSVCADAILSPSFRDHWNSAGLHPHKPTTRAQAEKIRELGYTGEIPRNIREASALIECLKIAKTYKRLRCDPPASPIVS